MYQKNSPISCCSWEYCSISCCSIRIWNQLQTSVRHTHSNKYGTNGHFQLTGELCSRLGEKNYMVWQDFLVSVTGKLGFKFTVLGMFREFLEYYESSQNTCPPSFILNKIKYAKWFPNLGWNEVTTQWTLPNSSGTNVENSYAQAWKGW